MEDFDNPNPELIKKLNQEIAKSGYPLEWEAAKIVEAHFAGVSRHSCYVDPRTGKLRETDLVATRSQQYSFRREEGFAASRMPYKEALIYLKTLIIECKQSSEQSWVFLSEPAPKFIARNSFNINETDNLGDAFLARSLRVAAHYSKIERCSYNYYQLGSGRELLQESFFQASNAAYASKASLSKMPPMVEKNAEGTGTKFGSFLDLYCPIVVFRGNMFEYRYDSGDPSVIPARHVLALFQVSFGTEEQNIPLQFLIDVVRIDHLADFLKQIQDETNSQMTLLEEASRGARFITPLDGA